MVGRQFQPLVEEGAQTLFVTISHKVLVPHWVGRVVVDLHMPPQQVQAQQALAAPAEKVETPTLMEVLLTLRLAVVVVAPVAQAQMLFQVQLVLVALALHRLLPDHLLHTVAAVVVESEQLPEARVPQPAAVVRAEKMEQVLRAHQTLVAEAVVQERTLQNHAGTWVVLVDQELSFSVT